MSTALKVQVGGSHYKGFDIQPVEFFIKNKIPFHKADIIKRIMRYKQPTGKGVEDLEKIKHYIDLILEIDDFNGPCIKYKTSIYEFTTQPNITKRQAKVIYLILNYDELGGRGAKDLNKIKDEMDLLIEFSEMNNEIL